MYFDEEQLPTDTDIDELNGIPIPDKPLPLQLTEAQKRAWENTKNYLKEEARRFNMSWWGAKVPTYGENNPPCGTTMCLAGAAVLANTRIKYDRGDKDWFVMPNGESLYTKVTIPQLARKLLGLTVEQKNALFYVSGWPGKYEVAYQSAHTPQERLQAGLDRMDYMLATGR